MAIGMATGYTTAPGTCMYSHSGGPFIAEPCFCSSLGPGLLEHQWNVNGYTYWSRDKRKYFNIEYFNRSEEEEEESESLLVRSFF